MTLIQNKISFIEEVQERFYRRSEGKDSTSELRTGFLKEGVLVIGLKGRLEIQ